MTNNGTSSKFCISSGLSVQLSGTLVFFPTFCSSFQRLIPIVAVAVGHTPDGMGDRSEAWSGGAGAAGHSGYTD